MKIYLIATWFFMGMSYFSMAFAEFLPQSFSAKFEQEYVSLLKGKHKTGKGLIEYMYPGKIRFETSTPSTLIFVSNGKKAWYYRAPFIEGEKGEVTESTAKEASSVYIKFFDSLKNGLVSNKDYEVKKGDPLNLTFNRKMEKELGLKGANIYLKEKNGQKFNDIEAIELLFPDGKKTKLKFIDLQINPNLKSERFNFIPPANTEKAH